MKKKRIKWLLVCIGMLAAGICYRRETSGVRDDGRIVFAAEEIDTAENEPEVPELPESKEEQKKKRTKDFKRTENSKNFSNLENPESFENFVKTEDSETDPVLAEEHEPETPVYEICVHICGAVQRPGVYYLPEQSRIFEAVEAAGGFTKEAAKDFLNMAQVIEDGAKIAIPSQEEVKNFVSREAGNSAAEPLSPGLQTGIFYETSKEKDGRASGKENSGKINLNTASKEELMTLKGIGESRAEDILTFRKEYGAFKTIEDVMKVPGIKDGAFKKIKDQITVS